MLPSLGTWGVNQMLIENDPIAFKYMTDPFPALLVDPAERKLGWGALRIKDQKHNIIIPDIRRQSKQIKGCLAVV